MRRNTGFRHIAVVFGTRPEIVKVAPIVRMLGRRARLVHSGQHADKELSGMFLSAAELPEPEALPGICGLPRHAQIGTMVHQLCGLFARPPPAALVGPVYTNTASAAP